MNVIEEAAKFRKSCRVSIGVEAMAHCTEVVVQSSAVEHSVHGPPNISCGFEREETGKPSLNVHRRVNYKKLDTGKAGKHATTGKPFTNALDQEGDVFAFGANICRKRTCYRWDHLGGSLGLVACDQPAIIKFWQGVKNLGKPDPVFGPLRKSQTIKLVYIVSRMPAHRGQFKGEREFACAT